MTAELTAFRNTLMHELLTDMADLTINDGGQSEDNLISTLVGLCEHTRMLRELFPNDEACRLVRNVIDALHKLFEGLIEGHSTKD